MGKKSRKQNMETPAQITPVEKVVSPVVQPVEIVPVREKLVIKVPIKRNRKPRLLVAEPRNPNFI